MDKATPAYTQEQVTLWLSRLARGMQRQGQTVFLIEHLQPSWLPGRWNVAAYGLVTRFGDGLVASWACGLIVLLFASISIFDINSPAFVLRYFHLFGPSSLAGAAVPALSLLLTDFRRLRSRPAITPHSQGIMRRFLSFLLRAATATVVASGPFSAIKWDSKENEFLALPLVLGCSALVFGVARGNLGKLTLRTGTSDVRTVERLVWSRSGAILGVVRALIVFCVYCAANLILSELAPVIGRHVRDLLFILTSLAAVSMVLLMPLRGAFRVVVREAKAVPNEGIRISLSNAGSIGWKSALGGTALALAILELAHPLPGHLEAVFFACLFGLGYGLLAAGWYGGVDVLRHYTLRYLLARKDYLPWDLAAFLDFCTDELHLLQRVGGGYMFLHRYLLEYFAGLGEGVEVKEGPAATPAHSDAVAG